MASKLHFRFYTQGRAKALENGFGFCQIQGPSALQEGSIELINGGQSCELSGGNIWR